MRSESPRKVALTVTDTPSSSFKSASGSMLHSVMICRKVHSDSLCCFTAISIDLIITDLYSCCGLFPIPYSMLPCSVSNACASHWCMKSSCPGTASIEGGGLTKRMLLLSTTDGRSGILKSLASIHSSHGAMGVRRRGSKSTGVCIAMCTCRLRYIIVTIRARTQTHKTYKNACHGRLAIASAQFGNTVCDVFVRGGGCRAHMHGAKTHTQTSCRVQRPRPTHGTCGRRAAHRTLNTFAVSWPFSPQRNLLEAHVCGAFLQTCAERHGA